ncbi:MAG: BrnT family toxin [Candidatus Omnitrophota bacterium]
MNTYKNMAKGMDKIKEAEYLFIPEGGGSFLWDDEKERLNILKHNVNFKTAAGIFKDPYIRIFEDRRHSGAEERFFALGKALGEVLTVRFTYRQEKIRIIGAGFWRKGRKLYEDQKE